MTDAGSRVIVVGAGAMGSLFGARLALAGHDVTFVDPYVEHVDAIREHGLIVRSEGGEIRVRVAAVPDAGDAEPGDLVLVLTKANQLRDALAAGPHLLAGAASVAVLSNGIGCDAVAAELVAADRLVYGATAAGAVLEAPGVVRDTVAGATYVGTRGGPASAAARGVADLLDAAGIPTEAVDDVRARVWRKAMVNVGYNAATSLARVRNGELAADTGSRAVLQAAVSEAVAVAAADGIELPLEETVADVVALGLGAIAPHRSSMLQDVLRGRETEVEFLNAAVAREGRRLGIPTPVNDTLAALVSALQAHYDAA